MPPDDPQLEEPPAASAAGAAPDVSGLVRAVRRRADLSQRELARRTGLAPSTIGRIESRTLAPSLGTLAAILEVAGVRLVAVDAENRLVRPMEEIPGEVRDGAGRRFPAHLDTILDPLDGEWWADRFGLARPPETFHRNREMRDVMRTRSAWEVRVAQFRCVPPPPTVEHWIQQQCRCESCGRLPAPVPPPFAPQRVARYLQAAAHLTGATGHGPDVARRTHGGAPHAPPDR